MLIQLAVTWPFVNPNKAEVKVRLSNLNNASCRTHYASIEDCVAYSEVTLTIAEAVNYVSLAIRMLYSEL